MSAEQRVAATKIMKRNLADHDDWIVLNASIETLAKWATKDDGLARWLKPHLERLSKDDRKSVASRARKKLSALNA